jgi:hypothetical protein
VKRLVEIHRRRRVDRDERDVRAVEIGQPRRLRGRARSRLDLGRERGCHLELRLDPRDPVAQGLRGDLVSGVDTHDSARGHAPTLMI